MKVTVFAPIQMEIEGIDRESEVRRVLNAIEQIISQSELESKPCINVELVGSAEIVVDDEQEVVVSLTAKEKAILARASNLLSCSDDNEILVMVKAIINHNNENELIDYIDGVVVWETVEFEFTVASFCKEIGYTGEEFKN